MKSPTSLMKCIICSDAIVGTKYLGTKKGITVVFCEQHAKECENCGANCTCEERD